MKTKTVRIDDDVRDVLVRSTLSADRVVLPPGQLDRDLYVRVDKALKAAGGKWSRKERAHLFAPGSDPRTLLGDVDSATTVVHRQQSFQSFQTPGAVARRLVGYARPQPGLRWLEPSAGRGTIVGAILGACSKVRLTAVDVDETMIPILRKICGVGLVLPCDFLALEDLEFDRIVMNPPWSAGQDIEHVTHAWGLLAPYGILVAVVSPGSLFGTRKKQRAFQQIVADHGEVLEDLPRGTFEDTDVAAKVIRLEAPPF